MAADREEAEKACVAKDAPSSKTPLGASRTRCQTPQRAWRRARRQGPPRAFAEAGKGEDERALIYGLHAVGEALANPKREVLRFLVTENALRRLALGESAKPAVRPEIVSPHEIARLLPPDAVHQGALVEALPLEAPALETLAPEGVRAGARSDHRSAQCRRNLAHRGGLRGARRDRAGAPQPGGDGRSRQIRLGRARACAAHPGAQSRRCADRARRARLPARRARFRRRGSPRRGDAWHAARACARRRREGAS